MSLALCQMMRPTCNDCGAWGLEWMSPLDLVHRQEDAASRERVREALVLLGVDGHAWACTRCSAWGLFE